MRESYSVLHVCSCPATVVLYFFSRVINGIFQNGVTASLFTSSGCCQVPKLASSVTPQMMISSRKKRLSETQLILRARILLLQQVRSFIVDVHFCRILMSTYKNIGLIMILLYEGFVHRPMP